MLLLGQGQTLSTRCDEPICEDLTEKPTYDIMFSAPNEHPGELFPCLKRLRVGET
jgi:hypothetical protein